MFVHSDVRVERLDFHVLDHGMVCGLIVKSKSLATKRRTCIQCSGQRVTIHMTPDLYVCFANLFPLIFPHDGVQITTVIYMFNPYFRFMIQVANSLVEIYVEGLLVITRGASVVQATNEGTDPFMMSSLILGVSPPLGIHQVHLTPDHAGWY